MPATKSPPGSPAAATEAPEPAPGASALPEGEAAAALAPAPRAYEYTWPDITVYQHIPLTAHPPIPAAPAVEATDGSPAIPARPGRPATVFGFADPPDGRWRPTDKPVNQAADNEPPLTVQEV